MADYFAAHTHCSAIVKVNDDLTELYASHNTWCSYSQLLRLYKTYVLPYKTPGTNAVSVMFSGYPGILEGGFGNVCHMARVSSQHVLTNDGMAC